MTRDVTTTGSFHVRWPCERFFWALIDASVLPAGERVSDERLRFMLEPELPLPLEDVHADFVPVTGSEKRFVACALPRIVLREETPSGALTIGPSEAPAFVREAVGERFDAARINLLVGEFEPGPVRKWRRRTSLATAAGVVLAFALVIVGIERRILGANDNAEVLRAQRDVLIARALGPAPAGQPLPPELRLEAELRALSLTRRQSETLSNAVAPVDATDRLTDLLAHWPTDVPTKTESIVVSDGAVHVHGVVTASEDAQRLATATGALTGLQASFPSVQAAPEGCRFGLEWTAATGAKR